MEETNAKAVIDLVERLDATEELAIGGVGEPATDLLVVSEKKKVIDLLPFHAARRETPLRREGTSVHTTLESFIDHIARHRDSQSVIFADDVKSPPTLTAIYDYNEATSVPLVIPSNVAAARVGTPRFGKHRAFYGLPLSDEWKAWQAISAGWMSQRDFAAALEDRLLEVMAPSDVPSRTMDEATKLGMGALGGPSTMMNLARGLFVRAERKLGQTQNLNTGEQKLTFEETHSTSDATGAPVTVPPGFAISIPVFRDGVAYALLARLRYVEDGGRVKWKIALQRADVALRDAFYDVTKDVKAKTGLPLFYGTPES